MDDLEQIFDRALHCQKMVDFGGEGWEKYAKELATIIAEIPALIDSYSREARINELTKTKDYIEDTIMIITNDLQSLLHHEEVYQLRRYHKDEIQKNIDERIAELKALGGKEANHE